MARRWLKPTPPPDANAPANPIWQRLGWMAIFMAGGLAAVAGSAYFLRSLLFL